jgi:hypothetical protein
MHRVDIRFRMLGFNEHLSDVTQGRMASEGFRHRTAQTEA